MLSRLPNSTLKVGAKVSLAPEAVYGASENNPRGIPGVVVTRPDYEAGCWLMVEWDNGLSNIYCGDHYDLIAEGEPGYLSLTLEE